MRPYPIQKDFFITPNVVKAARILNEELGLNIVVSKMVLSTIGIISGIEKLAQEHKQFRLAWSLVAASDQLRRKLIGAPNLSEIAEVVKAIQGYQQKTKRRVTIEYVLLGGVNDSADDIQELAQIAGQIDSHINLIPFNQVPGKTFRSGDTNKAFQQLKKLGVNVTVRKSLGQEIAAACGQLSASLKPAS